MASIKDSIACLEKKQMSMENGFILWTCGALGLEEEAYTTEQQIHRLTVTKRSDGVEPCMDIFKAALGNYSVLHELMVLNVFYARRTSIDRLKPGQ